MSRAKNRRESIRYPTQRERGYLNAFFLQNSDPSIWDVRNISQFIGMDVDRVRRWFRNRRQSAKAEKVKEKKINSSGGKWTTLPNTDWFTLPMSPYGTDFQSQLSIVNSSTSSQSYYSRKEIDAVSEGCGYDNVEKCCSFNNEVDGLGSGSADPIDEVRSGSARSLAVEGLDVGMDVCSRNEAILGALWRWNVYQSLLSLVRYGSGFCRNSEVLPRRHTAGQKQWKYLNGCEESRKRYKLNTKGRLVNSLANEGNDEDQMLSGGNDEVLQNFKRQPKGYEWDIVHPDQPTKFGSDGTKQTQIVLDYNVATSGSNV
ncbi:hypothetical protein BDP27DRAFT_1372209 [Rhodocollybia butyracea]|uniref:Homeobox domain-containing protein n=1 Tax=Rhodocollybia butyracea TaxID=206335 RepID=A0A9P5TXI4_9AGAR|nr:hypothetical protein BDP27DRAFT_1372209 [Rhodocollybia butyracea]